jgi:hypothetical protein
MNRIAAFLPFPDYETESEFVERTRKEGDIPEEAIYRSLLTPLPLARGVNMCGVAKAHCANKNKIIFCENLYGKTVSPTITIIDRYKKTVFCKKEIDTGTYEIALSGNARNFALIPSPGIPGSPMLNVYSTDDTDSKATHSFALSDCSCHTNCPIAFNKQSTQVIVHHLPVVDHYTAAAYILPNSNPCVITKPYTIFSLVSTENITNAQQKTLSRYFRLVCKEFGVAPSEQNS